MKTKQELLAKHREELAKLEREEAIRAELPEEIRESASICIFRDSVSVSAWNNFRTDKKLFDATRLVREMGDSIIEGEHWKAGCLSTQPAEINSYAKDENATMDGSHAVEILVSGGKGYGPDTEVRFWVKLPSGTIAEIHAPVSNLWKLVPHVDANYDQHGHITTCRIDWPTESRCVDKFRSWWSEKPSYRGSYYLADLANFYAWASSVVKETLAPMPG